MIDEESIITTTQSSIQVQPLTSDEQSRLATYEGEVEQGFEALAKIRDEGLWREYESFEAYFTARFNNSALSNRRRNQLIASFRVYVVLETQLEGTGVPINATEYGLRPLISIADENPQLAAQIAKSASVLAGGEIPSHAQIVIARSLELTPDEIRKRDAISQLRAMQRYEYLVHEINAGSDPAKLLGLAVAIEACEPALRKIFIHIDMRDLSLIRALNDDYVRGSETAQEVIATGYLQCEKFSIPLRQATARHYRQLKDIVYLEKKLAAHAAKRGEPESIVVFHSDSQGTLESLLDALGYMDVIALGNLIGQI